MSFKTQTVRPRKIRLISLKCQKRNLKNPQKSLNCWLPPTMCSFGVFCRKGEFWSRKWAATRGQKQRARTHERYIETLMFFEGFVWRCLSQVVLFVSTEVTFWNLKSRLLGSKSAGFSENRCILVETADFGSKTMDLGWKRKERPLTGSIYLINFRMFWRIPELWIV